MILIEVLFEFQQVKKPIFYVFQFCEHVKPMAEGGSIAVRLKPLVEMMGGRNSTDVFRFTDLRKEVMSLGSRRSNSVRFGTQVKSAYIMPVHEENQLELLSDIQQGN